MEKSTSIANIAKALLNFNKKVEAIPKDSNNPFFRSKYASLPNVIEHTRQLLADCDLVLTQWPDENNGLVSLLVHCASGEYLQSTYHIHPVPDYIKEKDNKGEVVFRSEYYLSPQAVGSAITYARRYAQCAILNLAVEDDDGNAGSGRTEQPKNQQKQEAPKAESKEDQKEKPKLQPKNQQTQGEKTAEPEKKVMQPNNEFDQQTEKETPKEKPKLQPKNQQKQEAPKAEPVAKTEGNPPGDFALDVQDRKNLIEKVGAFTEAKALMDAAPGLIAEYKKTAPSKEDYEAFRKIANDKYNELVEAEKAAKKNEIV